MGKGPPRYVGVDPGREGFICVVDERCQIVVMWRIPYLDTRVDVVRLKKMIGALSLINTRFVYLEKQQVHAKEGAQGAFTGGDGYGCLRTMISAFGLRHEEIRPQEWKREAKIPVPNVPKSNLPPKPSTKKAQAAWKKECKALNDKRARTVKAKRKELACRKAQTLQPEYDFRLSTRAKKPHDGKCEAFLMAREAWKLERRENPRSRR